MTKAEQIARAVVALARYINDREGWDVSAPLWNQLEVVTGGTNYWPMRWQLITFAQTELAKS